MEDHGIAWMIAGGVRAQSEEDRRQRLHRIALADSKPARGDTLLQLRQRIATIVGARSEQIAPDCCPA